MADERDQARRLWEESGGTLPPTDIAKQLGVSPGTVRTWKRRDKWGETEAAFQAFRKSETQRETNRKRQASVNRAAAKSVENNDTLLESEKDFCFRYVTNYNAAQSAWDTGRYSNWNSAKSGGWAMLQKPAVRAEIKRLKEMKRAAMLADGDDVVERLMRIAFAGLDQIADFGSEEGPVMDESGPVMIENLDTGERKPVMREQNYVRLKDSATVDGALLAEVRIDKDGVLSVKRENALEALKILYQHFSMNSMDRHKKEFDNKRLELERRRVELEERKAAESNEDALARLDALLKGVDDRA